MMIDKGYDEVSYKLKVIFLVGGNIFGKAIDVMSSGIDREGGMPVKEASIN